jgi:hypothetical protein
MAHLHHWSEPNPRADHRLDHPLQRRNRCIAINASDQLDLEGNSHDVHLSIRI